MKDWILFAPIALIVLALALGVAFRSNGPETVTVRGSNGVQVTCTVIHWSEHDIRLDCPTD